MEIAPLPSGDYRIAFSTGGCLGRCKFERTGRLRDGVLKLDSAVAEYLPREYDTLYTVRVNGEEFLLPAAFVQNFENDRNIGIDRDKDRILRFCVFRRETGKDEDRNLNPTPTPTP